VTLDEIATHVFGVRETPSGEVLVPRQYSVCVEALQRRWGDLLEAVRTEFAGRGPGTVRQQVSNILTALSQVPVSLMALVNPVWHSVIVYTDPETGYTYVMSPPVTDALDDEAAAIAEQLVDEYQLEQFLMNPEVPPPGLPADVAQQFRGTLQEGASQEAVRQLAQRLAAEVRPRAEQVGQRVEELDRAQGTPAAQQAGPLFGIMRGAVRQPAAPPRPQAQPSPAPSLLPPVFTPIAPQQAIEAVQTAIETQQNAPGATPLPSPFLGVPAPSPAPLPSPRTPFGTPAPSPLPSPFLTTPLPQAPPAPPATPAGSPMAIAQPTTPPEGAIAASALTALRTMGQVPVGVPVSPVQPRTAEGIANVVQGLVVEHLMEWLIAHTDPQMERALDEATQQLIDLRNQIESTVSPQDRDMLLSVFEQAITRQPVPDEARDALRAFVQHAPFESPEEKRAEAERTAEAIRNAVLEAEASAPPTPVESRVALTQRRVRPRAARGAPRRRAPSVVAAPEAGFPAPNTPAAAGFASQVVKENDEDLSRYVSNALSRRITQEIREYRGLLQTGQPPEPLDEITEEDLEGFASVLATLGAPFIQALADAALDGVETGLDQLALAGQVGGLGVAPPSQ
jgi:hypothetical protein